MCHAARPRGNRASRWSQHRSATRGELLVSHDANAIASHDEPCRQLASIRTDTPPRCHCRRRRVGRRLSVEAPTIQSRLANMPLASRRVADRLARSKPELKLSLRNTKFQYTRCRCRQADLPEPSAPICPRDTALQCGLQVAVLERRAPTPTFQKRVLHIE